MTGTAKRFRIEMLGDPGGRSIVETPGALDRHAEIMASLDAIRLSLAAGGQTPPQSPARPEQAAEAVDLKATAFRAELGEIHAAILRTKKEIASLHHSGFQGVEMSRVRDELDAIVTGTEQATNVILAAAEAVDERAANLTAKLKGDDQGMAADIQEHVVHIFEACNFQDLTGQRITKVVGTLRFIEERVARMIDIWGGLDSFSEVEPEPMRKPQGDGALLNGPALEGEAGRASQDDIDAMFA